MSIIKKGLKTLLEPNFSNQSISRILSFNRFWTSPLPIEWMTISLNKIVHQFCFPTEVECGESPPCCRQGLPSSHRLLYVTVGSYPTFSLSPRDPAKRDFTGLHVSVAPTNKLLQKVIRVSY